jgi:hypothetical protein
MKKFRGNFDFVISKKSLLWESVIDNAVTLDFIFKRLWLPLKGISIEKTYIGKLPCTIPTVSITFTQKIWGLTRDRFLSQRCH